MSWPARPFRLYDTYGFPLDLTQDALRARGMTVDVAGFDQAMERQRAEARASWKGSEEQAEERIWFELREVIGATEFLGYEHECAEAQVKALVVGGTPAQRAEPGGEVMVVTNQTPFYGESGGQIGDTGTIRRGPAGPDQRHPEARRPARAHGPARGRAARGRRCRRDGDRGERRAGCAGRIRRRICCTALRRHLGSHVTQKGSLVAPDRLRFDFSHPKAVTPDSSPRSRPRSTRFCARTLRSGSG